jgi:hypothetical protein
VFAQAIGFLRSEAVWSKSLVRLGKLWRHRKEFCPACEP